MWPRIGERRGGLIPLLIATGLALTACSSGASSTPRADVPSSPTTSATTASASTGGLDTATLQHRLDAVLKPLLRSGSAHEDLYVAGADHPVDVGWSAGGHVYDQHYPFPKVGTPGREFRHAPGARLERASDGGESCWFPAGPDAAHVERPVTPEVALMRSARASSGGRFTMHGSVEIAPLLQLLGTDAELRANHLVARDGMRVEATFQVGSTSVIVQTNAADAIRQLGLAPKKGRWSWQISLGGLKVPLTAIPDGRRIDVPRTDPSFATEIRACDAHVPGAG